MSQPRYKSEVVDFEQLAARLEELEDLGYTCEWDLLERADFGPLQAWLFARPTGTEPDEEEDDA